MYLFRSLLVWLCFIPAAILNGGLREHVLTGWLGATAATAASGVLLSLLILLISWLLLPRVVRLSRKESYAAGILWAVLTVGFEFAFGLGGGTPLPELLAAYNPLTGNLWTLVVLTTLLTPAIVYHQKKESSPKT